jgi:hypothetical protein
MLLVVRTDATGATERHNFCLPQANKLLGPERTPLAHKKPANRLEVRKPQKYLRVVQVELRGSSFPPHQHNYRPDKQNKPRHAPPD